MFFETAQIYANPYLLFFTAFIISTFTSMGGVSGAFLILPFQMSILGYTAPSVSATNQFYNVIAIPSGVYRYWREKRMIWSLAFFISLATLPGIFIGAYIRVSFLPDPTLFKFFAGLVLFYIGSKLSKDIWQTKGQPLKSGNKNAVTVVKTVSFKEISYDYDATVYHISTMALSLVCFTVGIVGGTYGIGGGAIIAPILVSFFKLPVHSIASSALFATFTTSVFGVAFYQSLASFYNLPNVAPDFKLGFFLGLGGIAGMYLGARLQKFFPAHIIKIMLASFITFIALSYIWNFIKAFL
ncbi:MAG: sulfite exporter TauE/SafE family protein [Alphaproteobacteria bacterium]